VEGTLLNLGAVRPVGFFTWNGQTFTERWARRGALALSALFRPLLYATNRSFATRVLHTLLRGVSQDRLDLLGEEYFHYVLKPNLNQKSVDKLLQLIASDRDIVLVSQGLDHVMRPLAEFLGVRWLVANRLEWKPEIERELARGTVILCDRYLASSIAYGEAFGLDAQWLGDIQRSLPPPDLTVLLDIEPQVSASRKTTDRDKYERDLALLARVRASYLRQAAAPGWLRLDAGRDRDVVAAEVYSVVAPLLTSS